MGKGGKYFFSFCLIIQGIAISCITESNSVCVIPVECDSSVMEYGDVLLWWEQDTIEVTTFVNCLDWELGCSEECHFNGIDEGWYWVEVKSAITENTGVELVYLRENKCVTVKACE